MQFLDEAEMAVLVAPGFARRGRVQRHSGQSGPGSSTSMTWHALIMRWEIFAYAI